MRDPDATHPDLQQLTQFGQGRLVGDDSTEVENHVSACDTCRRTLLAIPSDPFMDLLRDAADPAVRPSHALHLGYEILGELGRGGMGIVYRARQLSLNRVVALKKIRNGLDASRGTLARFRREAEAVARLQHPNVVQVYEVGEQDGHPFLALELVEGPSLLQVLSDGPLAPRPAARLVAVLAGAVAHAHARGVVHRDLKPANVLLQASGEDWRTRDEAPDGGASFPVVKITDFGLAKYLHDSIAGPTETGNALGTPCYMSPEQAAGVPERVGPATDVYALGAILYECLTGRPPFRAATAMETLRQVTDQEPVPVRHLQPGVPVELATICHKCLRKEEAARYPSAEALAADLGRFLRGEPVQARPLGRAARVWRWARRRPAAAALVGLAITLPPALGLAAVAYVHRLGVETERSAAAAAEAVRQRERADRNYRKARETLEKMLDDLGGGEAAAVPRLTELQAKEAEHALAFFEAAADDADPADPATRLDIARASQRAGVVAMMLRRDDLAREHFLRSLRLLDESADADLGRVVRAGRATCLGRLGYCASAAGDYAAAERYQRQALAVFEELAAEDGGGPSDNLAWALHALGQTCLNANRLADAERHFRRSADLRQELVRRGTGPVAAYRLAGGQTLANLILVYRGLGQYDRARAEFQTAEDLLRPVLEVPARRTEAALALAAAGQNIAEAVRAQGKPGEAIRYCDRGLALVEPILRRDPELAPARSYVLNLHGTRATANQALERYAAAVTDYDRIVDLADDAARDVFRVNRVILLAYAGDRRRARAEADDLVANGKPGDPYLFNLALTYGYLMEGEKDTSAIRDAGDRAVAVLTRLARGDLFRQKQYATMLRTAPEFNAVRGRKEFQQIVQGLPAN